jgi:hypothetical protein
VKRQKDRLLSKQKSNRKRKREEAKEAASSAATTPPVTMNTPTPIKNTPTTPTTVEDEDMYGTEQKSKMRKRL